MTLTRAATAAVGTLLLVVSACSTGDDDKSTSDKAPATESAAAPSSKTTPQGASAEAKAKTASKQPDDTGAASDGSAGDAPAEPATSRDALGDLLNQVANALGQGKPAQPGGAPTGSMAPGAAATPVTPVSPVPSAAPVSPEALASLRTLCTQTINNYRATIGRSALALDTAKSACADTQAQADGQVGRAHANFGDCGESAQDECPRQGSGDFAKTLTACLGRMWAEGPGGGHYENMASARYTKVSCGFTTVNGSIWMIQNFHR